MLLPPLQPDPEPSEADIARHLVGVPRGLPDAIRQRMAALSWEGEKQKADPNAFRVCFATNVREFPGGGHDYEVYRQSSLWRRIRRHVLKLADYRCAACPAKATEVHHRDYRPRVLAGDDLTPLVPLCHCHTRVHYDGPVKRESWQACERILAAMVAAKTN